MTHAPTPQTAPAGPAPRPAVKPARGPEWRTTRCQDCGAQTETNRWGDTTLCECDAVY